MKVSWRGSILAESERTIIVEGHHYFPPESIAWEYLRESTTTSICPWKGQASYYDIEVAGEVNKDAAWTYPNPKDPAKHIAGYVAFWRGVEVTE